METKTFLVLFCMVFVHLIGGYESAPTSRPLVTRPPSPPSPPTPRPTPRIGGFQPFSKQIDSRAKKLFNDYKKIIIKKLQAVHKVPAKFVPKPDKYTVFFSSVTRHQYLVKLPIKKYARVIIFVHPKDTKYGSDERVQVQPQLYGFNDDISP